MFMFFFYDQIHNGFLQNKIMFNSSFISYICVSFATIKIDLKQNLQR